ncbi:DbpA RNA binding domain-containing protein [Methylomicrobium lacus]|uniref:DbpA RNA binding domain-containing protein n=1 Tax=Methylomicrobium lacus TaxID=136992 RepID=UPI0035A81969
MNNTDKPSLSSGLDGQLQQIVNSEDLGDQRAHLKTLSASLGFDLLDCAAALLFLLQNPAKAQAAAPPPAEAQRGGALRRAIPQTIKMVRYRLDVGRQHQVTAEELKKVLVEESGVDKNNIANIDIQDFYTLLELPDEMPPDIFQHLKSVEINRQALDIRRVKNRRPKKRGNSRYGRHRQQSPKSQTEATGLSGKN